MRWTPLVTTCCAVAACAGSLPDWATRDATMSNESSMRGDSGGALDAGGAADKGPEPGTDGRPDGRTRRPDSRIHGRSRSCLDILKAEPSAADGTYTIYPSGAGSPLKVTCDMTTSGGGWTVVHRADFDDGTPNGWADRSARPAPVQTSAACATAYSSYLGPLGQENQPASQSFALHGIPHTEVFLSFGYLFVDTWAGAETGTVAVDGAEVWTLSASAAGGVGCWVLRGDEAVRPPSPVSVQTKHTAATVTVALSSHLDEAIQNESFGVDNVVIMIR